MSNAAQRPPSPSAFFLSSCSKQASAQLTITSIPPRAMEGGNITLSVQGLPQNLISYNWFRGAATSQDTRILNFKFTNHALTPEPAHSGRETGSADGSLTVTDVRVLDSGIYTLQLISVDRTSGHYAMLLLSGKGIPLWWHN